jgi:hypothetical protein
MTIAAPGMRSERRFLATGPLPVNRLPTGARYRARKALAMRARHGYRTATQAVVTQPRRPLGARSSVGEHYVDIVGVAGSIPAAPTILCLSPGSPRSLISIRRQTVNRPLSRLGEVADFLLPGLPAAPDTMRRPEQLRIWLLLGADQHHRFPRVILASCLFRPIFAVWFRLVSDQGAADVTRYAQEVPTSGTPGSCADPPCP